MNDREFIIDMLLNPPEPSQRLRAAAERYKKGLGMNMDDACKVRDALHTSLVEVAEGMNVDSLLLGLAFTYQDVAMSFNVHIGALAVLDFLRERLKEAALRQEVQEGLASGPATPWDAQEIKRDKLQ